MKKMILGLNLILILSLAGFAQKPETGKSRTVKADNGPTVAAGTTLDAQLQQTLDVKKAKVGDQVVMKVTKSIKQNGETIVPKGANLVGRVTEVQQKTKDNAVSRLGVVFDRIQGQNLNSPVNATIVSILSAGANASAGDMLDSDISGTSSSSGRVMGQSSTTNTSSSAGGGLLGGVAGTVGGVANTATNTVGGVAGTATNTVGNVAGATTRTVGGTAQTLGQTVNGIRISPSAGASANGSTTLSAADKNLRLEKGANFQLRLNGMGGAN